VVGVAGFEPATLSRPSASTALRL